MIREINTNSQSKLAVSYCSKLFFWVADVTISSQGLLKGCNHTMNFCFLTACKLVLYCEVIYAPTVERSVKFDVVVINDSFRTIVPESHYSCSLC